MARPKHAVADELEALVVAALALAAAHARVRERNLQEILILEAVTERLLEFLVFARAQHGCGRVAHPRRPRKGMSAFKTRECRAPGGDHNRAQRTSLKKRLQRMSNGQVHGLHQRKASGSSTAAEKKMISARPIKFSNGT